jgi:hypothetical protein
VRGKRGRGKGKEGGKEGREGVKREEEEERERKRRKGEEKGKGKRGKMPRHVGVFDGGLGSYFIITQRFGLWNERRGERGEERGREGRDQRHVHVASKTELKTELKQWQTRALTR